MDSKKEALEAIKRDLKNPLELRGTMEQAVRSALDRVEALLTAEPELCEKQSPLFVDATPDDGYVTRILSAYIDDSYYSDNTIGLPPENPLVKQMNEWREQRNALLRAAISKLNASQVADKRVEELRETVETLREALENIASSTVYAHASGKYSYTLEQCAELASRSLAATEPKPPQDDFKRFEKRSGITTDVDD